jgi:hypothetical protein
MSVPEFKKRDILAIFDDVFRIEEIQNISINKDVNLCAKKIFNKEYDTVTDIEFKAFWNNIIIPIAYDDFQSSNTDLNDKCKRIIYILPSKQVSDFTKSQ